MIVITTTKNLDLETPAKTSLVANAALELGHQNITTIDITV